MIELTNLHGGSGGLVREQVSDEAGQVVLGVGQEHLQLCALRCRLHEVLQQHQHLCKNESLRHWCCSCQIACPIDM